jgi:hypothetical protein
MFNKILSIISVVPNWCNFFRKDEHLEFVSLITKHLDSTGYKYEFKKSNSLVTLYFSSDPKDKLELSMNNLAQLCNQKDIATWPETIKTHFDVTIATN